MPTGIHGWNVALSRNDLLALWRAWLKAGYEGDDPQEAREILTQTGHRVGRKSVRERIEASVEPLREHAALKEEARQNRFAADLWKAHAESALVLTDYERGFLRGVLTEFGAENPETAATVLGILRKM